MLVAAALDSTGARCPALNPGRLPGRAVRRRNAPACDPFPGLSSGYPGTARVFALREDSPPPSFAVCQMPSPQERRSVPASLCRSGIFHFHYRKYHSAAPQNGHLRSLGLCNMRTDKMAAQGMCRLMREGVSAGSHRLPGCGRCEVRRLRLSRRQGGCAAATHDSCPGRGV